MISFGQANEQSNIYDYLDYLEADQLIELQTSIENIQNEHGLDPVIVITDDTEGKSSQDYADDFYDYNNFGLDKEYSGLLLLINMDIREVHISTTGKAIRICTDQRNDIILDIIAPHLSKDNYYGACVRFLRQVDYYADRGIPENQHNYDTETGQVDYYDGRQDTYNYYGRGNFFTKRIAHAITSPITFIIAGLSAVFITLAASRSSRGRKTTNKMTYEQGGSFMLTAQKDQYIRQTTTRTKIETSSTSSGRSSSSSSGRSSTHRSSSGRSHGGRSRKF